MYITTANERELYRVYGLDPRATYFTVKELVYATGESGQDIRKWLRMNVSGDPRKHEWRISKIDALRCIRHFVLGK